MNESDVIGLKKLVETVSNGLGVLGNHFFEFDVKKIKRTGNAEAEVEKEKIIKRAEGNAASLEIMTRAEVRVKLIQYQEQINLENIFAGSKDLLEGKKVSDIPVDKDWSMRFIDIAKGVSKEEIQAVLSQVLAREIIRPNSYSLKTLEFLKNLTKADFLFMRRLLIISSISQVVYIDKDDCDNGFFDFKYTDVMMFIEMGICRPNINSNIKYNDFTRGAIFEIQLFNNFSKRYQYHGDQNYVSFGVIQLTQIGKELCTVLDLDGNDKQLQIDYFESLKIYLKSKNIIEIE